MKILHERNPLVKTGHKMYHAKTNKKLAQRVQIVHFVICKLISQQLKTRFVAESAIIVFYSGLKESFLKYFPIPKTGE